VFPHDHPPVKTGRIGVLLLNLGTPDATDYWSMRRYLKEFLWDWRVTEEPRLKWWFILNGPILTFRPRRKGKDYEKIWNSEHNESPLKTIMRSLAERLAETLSGESRVVVEWAMRYANPSTESRIHRLAEHGCDRLLIVPLYPQYAGATTATACDQVFRTLLTIRWQPTLRVAPCYYDDRVYIDALRTTVSRHLAGLDWAPEAVIASFHGMPLKFLLAGDPYHCQCQKTSRLLRAALSWPTEGWFTTFQSRFGNDPWLQPYTDRTIERLAKSGIRRLAVVAPGFSADCLETLEELDVENRLIFLRNGGETFSYVPALNYSDAGLRLIEHIVRRELAGWL
jgi:ferrochelatase